MEQPIVAGTIPCFVADSSFIISSTTWVYFWTNNPSTKQQQTNHFFSSYGLIILEAYSGRVPQGVDRNTNETQVNFTGLTPGTEYNIFCLHCSDTFLTLQKVNQIAELQLTSKL